MFGQPSTSNQHRNHILVSSGNETFDTFLGGGFLHTSLNLIERQGIYSRILDLILNNSFATSTLTSKNNLLFVNFNASREWTERQVINKLPQQRKIKTEILYDDVYKQSSSAKIKIAWRYTSRDTVFPDKSSESYQIDFRLGLNALNKDNIGEIAVINAEHEDAFTFKSFFEKLDTTVERLRKPHNYVNIIIKDLLHPFSPLVDKPKELMRLFLLLRCFSRRMDRGAILVVYDVDMFSEHEKLKNKLYNLADSVVSFFSYQNGQNVASGYPDSDGMLEYIKVPKIKSFGLHFQREVSDWGYRITKNYRFLVIDELSLPPCPDNDEANKAQVKKRIITDEIDIFDKGNNLQQVSPLEDFREVAKNVLPRKS